MEDFLDHARSAARRTWASAAIPTATGHVEMLADAFAPCSYSSVKTGPKLVAGAPRSRAAHRWCWCPRTNIECIDDSTST